MQRTSVQTCPYFLLGLAGLLQRQLWRQGDKTVQLRVKLLDALQIGLYQLDG